MRTLFQMVGALALAALAALAAEATAQDAARERPAGFPGLPAGRAPRVEIPFNRLYDLPELYGHFDRLVAAYPELLSMEVIGESVEGRELRVYTLNDPSTGDASTKPAMWIDGNVHGNEVQASEAVLYAAWYLLENHGSNERVDALLARASFYLLPSQNPDGRSAWFNRPATASSFRSGNAPWDNDQDGVADEDPPNDLDGDGSITQMRKYAPGEGTHRADPDDPRLMERVPGDSEAKGDWLLLGREGIDDDGDGRFDEDGLGGYDMNRAWPSFWQPNHVQFGAGPYPLFWPETRAIADWILERPNLAAAQSFHNSGGMILRGPGAEDFGEYPRADLRVYDELGEDGEKMLPFYNYWVIWSDLYTVFGGFVNWTYEGLGVISFTNELWVSERASPDDRLSGSSEDRQFFDDALLMGAGFTDWAPYDHPFYGEVEIGGFVKDVGRVPPSFLIEEMLHRNALFCLRHAEAMPEVEIDEPVVEDLGDGLLAVEVVLRNRRAIPTRTALAAQEKMGVPDVITLAGAGVEVLAVGERTDRFRPERLDLVEREPGRIVRERGIGGRDELRLRYLVRGSGEATIAWTGEKARDVARTFSLDG